MGSALSCLCTKLYRYKCCTAWSHISQKVAWEIMAVCLKAHSWCGRFCDCYWYSWKTWVLSIFHVVQILSLKPHEFQASPILSSIASKQAQEEFGSCGMKSLRSLALIGAGVSGLLGFATVASADEAEHGLECPSYPWPHAGILSSYDHASWVTPESPIPSWLSVIFFCSPSFLVPSEERIRTSDFYVFFW